MTEAANPGLGRTATLQASPSRGPMPRFRSRLAPRLSDCVVARETAHLVELNHSKRFRRLAETLYPDWRAARRRIGSVGATLPILQEDPP